MKLKTSRKTLTVAVATALSAGMAFSPAAVADSANPFGATELSSGYMQVASAHGEGGCGEAKCGAKTSDKKAEGSCGEGKCGEAGTKAKGEGSCGEGKCGEATTKAKGEGSCGEGKCGTN